MVEVRLGGGVACPTIHFIAAPGLSMGYEAEDILRSLDLTQDDQKKYIPVKDKFNGHSMKQRSVSVPFEHTKFNMRKQEVGEPVDVFITVPYSLAEHCAYGTLHNEMIHD